MRLLNIHDRHYAAVHKIVYNEAKKRKAEAEAEDADAADHDHDELFTPP